MAVRLKWSACEVCGRGPIIDCSEPRRKQAMATADAKLHVTEFTNEPFIDFSNPDNRKKMEDALKRVKAEFGHEYPMWIAGNKVVTDKKRKSTIRRGLRKRLAYSRMRRKSRPLRRLRRRTSI